VLAEIPGLLTSLTLLLRATNLNCLRIFSGRGGSPIIGPPIIETVNIPPIAAGASHQVVHILRLQTAGTYRAMAAADVNQEVTEAYEDNNAKTVSLTVRESGPDLVVQSLTYAPENPTTADYITFTMVVQNAGNATAGESVLRLDARYVAYPLFWQD